MDKSKELQQFIHDMVEHEVDHAVTDARHVNRSVGEAMRHIGSMMFNNSTAYLPIRPEEVLCKPEVMLPGDTTAALLTHRWLYSKQSFLIMITASTALDGSRNFSFNAYQPDEFDLRKTRFVAVPDQLGNEIIRQLGNVLKGDGVSLMCCTVVADYFKPEETGLSQDTPPSAPAGEAQPQASENQLPAVNHDLL